MRIKMWCETHHSPVVSAEGANLHWIPLEKSEIKSPAGIGHYSHWELDEANLYCTGGEGDHEFRYSIEV